MLEEGEAVTLADVRDAVERDVRDARDQAASDALYARLRARYTVRVEKPAHGLEAAAAQSRHRRRDSPVALASLLPRYFRRTRGFDDVRGRLSARLSRAARGRGDSYDVL